MCLWGWSYKVIASPGSAKDKLLDCHLCKPLEKCICTNLFMKPLCNLLIKNWLECEEITLNSFGYIMWCFMNYIVIVSLGFSVFVWLSAEGITFCCSPCVHVWLYTKSLWPRYLTNRLWEFHHIYYLCTVGDKGELIKFCGQRSRSRRDQIWSKRHLGNFEGHGFKVQGHKTTFSAKVYWCPVGRRAESSCVHFFLVVVCLVVSAVDCFRHDLNVAYWVVLNCTRSLTVHM